MKPIGWGLYARFNARFKARFKLTPLFARLKNDAAIMKHILMQCAASAALLLLVLGSLCIPAQAIEADAQKVNRAAKNTVQSSDFRAYTVFDKAEFTQNKSLTPPREAQWAAVTLPDSWNINKRDRSAGFGWYRFRFSHQGEHHDGYDALQRALYIPRITNNVEVFLNGSSFAVSGRLAPEPENAWNRAQYFLIPPSLFKSGENELLIRLHPDGFLRSGLSKVYLGDSDALSHFFEQRYLIQTTAPQIITGLLVVMAIFSLAIWAKRRSETMFLFFALMALVAVIRLVHYYLRTTPEWLNFLAVPSLAWLTFFQLQFSFRFANHAMPRIEKGLLIFTVISSLILLVLPFAAPAAYGNATAIIYLLLTLAAPFLLAALAYALTRERSPEKMILLAALVLNSALGLHDTLAYQERLGFDRLYLLPLGLPMILFAVAALLVKRFVATLSGYEALNADLARRVAEREAALQSSFEQMRQLDQQRATAEERQRLMRDMHDGIGSHLMSTLALARMGSLSNKDMAEVLADCIDELKLTIDSLEPVESDLLVVLGNLRYRLEPRLNAAGISLEWAVKDLPPLAYLDPENIRSVLRIVQEAFTNTLKHARAKRITISTGIDYASNRVLVRIMDDGVGVGNLAEDQKYCGRGIDNMKRRATKLGGAIEFTAMKGSGTCVNLYLPITLTTLVI